MLRILLILCFFSFGPVVKSVQAQWIEETHFDLGIYALKAFDNQLHVTGNFFFREGKECLRTCYKDGNGFTNNPIGFPGPGINEMAIFQGNLYGTGGIPNNGNYHLVKWDGTNWISTYVFDRQPVSIFSTDTHLYVADEKSNITVFDNNGASEQLPRMDDFFAAINAFTFYNGELYVAGSFTTFNDSTLNSVARWDGSTWQPVGIGVRGNVNAIKVFNNELIIGGAFNAAPFGAADIFNLARWNGSNWVDLGGSIRDHSLTGVKDMLVHQNKLYIVGDFNEVGGKTIYHTAKWDGSTWESLGYPYTSAPLSSIEVYSGRLYMGALKIQSPRLYSTSIGSEGFGTLQEEGPLYVSPNPSPDVVTLTWKEAPKGSYRVHITDTRGKLVAADVYPIETLETTYNCSQWKEGVYIFQVFDEASKEVLVKKKFVKS